MEIPWICIGESRLLYEVMDLAIHHPAFLRLKRVSLGSLTKILTTRGLEPSRQSPGGH